MLRAADLFIFDEFPSLDSEVFEAAYRAMEEFRHKTVICMGDFRQIAPVVSGGDRTQTVNASTSSSPLWDTFQVKHLTVNLRLRGLMDDIENMTQEEIDDLHMQQWFARTLDAIGNCNHPIAFN